MKFRVGVPRDAGCCCVGKEVRMGGAFMLVRFLYWAVCVLLWPSALLAQGSGPLLAVDTSSPQATVRTFYELTEALETSTLALKASPTATRQAEVESLVGKAISIFDLSKVPPLARRDVGGDALVFLVDVLRRIEVPRLESIPDAKAFPDEDKPASWTMPGTEIVIVRVLEGPKRGRFVFDAETVARAGEFYSLVKNLPLRVPARVPSWREAQLQLHGWMIPNSWIDALPWPLKVPILDTPTWKVLGTSAIILFLAGMLALWHRMITPNPEEYSPLSYFRRLLVPVGVVCAISGAKFLVGHQINLIGTFAELVELALALALYAAAAWAAWLVVFVVVEWIIKSPKIPDQSLDANLLRLLGRMLGIVAVASIVAYGAQELGLPVLGVLAGLGVGGLAVALAAQSSIENLIGGLNLYADRPIRVGDFCEYAGIKGHVEHIGLRSTRIRGLDRTVTSVPNSLLAKVHVTNYQMRDQMLFQHVLDLRYETTTHQLRVVSTSIRTFLSSHPKVRADFAAPRVHVVGFGDWSIKVEVYAYVDATTLPKFLAIQEELAIAIFDLVRRSGADFAFPSQTTYFSKDRHVPLGRDNEVAPGGAVLLPLFEIAGMGRGHAHERNADR
jgi:MscS family membrane protein